MLRPIAFCLQDGKVIIDRELLAQALLDLEEAKEAHAEAIIIDPICTVGSPN